MDNTNRLFITQKIEPILRKNRVRRSSLFGSFAREEADDKSDVDLLVDMPDDASLFDLVSLKLELEDALKKNVDIVTFRSIHKLLRERIEKEAIPIF